MSRVPTQAGQVGILNTGEGDTKLSFDPSKPAERIRAARIVKDMIRRGYALLVEREVDGVKGFVRATDFDETACEYIIADFDPITAAEADAREENANGEQDQTQPGATPPTGSPAAPRPRGRPRKVVVPAESTRAVAVARISGG